VFIGEVITFHLQADLPEGTVSTVSFEDTLPAGLAYVAGSGQLARTFDTDLTASLDPGGVNGAPSGTFVPLTDGVEVIVAGQIVTVDLGDVVNADADANAESFTLELLVVVENVAGNQAGITLTNDAAVNFLDALMVPGSLTDTEGPFTIIEAALQILKFASPTQLDADIGGDVHFTITVTNPVVVNGAPAYDVGIFDAVPSEYSNVRNVFVNAIGGAVGVVDNSTEFKMDVDVAFMPPGSQVTVDFDATAEPPLPIKIVNGARATWTSVPGTNGSGGSTPGDPGTPDGERRASDGYKVNARSIVGTSADPTPSRTRAPTTTPPPTRTLRPTRTPASTRTRAPTFTPVASNTPAPPTATRTPERGSMDVRLVAVGRVNPGSQMTYSIALVLQGRGRVPDVGAVLELPETIEFVRAVPEATSEPPTGGTGTVTWDLGDLTGPANRSLRAVVRVRRDVADETVFSAKLTVENGFDETFIDSRESRVGGGPQPRASSRAISDRLRVDMRAPTKVRPEGRLRYTIGVGSFLREGIGEVLVRAVLAPKIDFETAIPDPTANELTEDGARALEWRFANAPRVLRLRINGAASAELAPGEVLEVFVNVDDGESDPLGVVGTTTVR
jgi:fimbrial isopeptide formation D2 family protein